MSEECLLDRRRGRSLPESVSIVVTRRPTTSSTGTRHESIGSPSTSTVQLPQPPCRQPSLTAGLPELFAQDVLQRGQRLDHRLDLTVAEPERDDSRRHSTDSGLGAAVDLLERAADEQADHPPPIPGRRDRRRRSVRRHRRRSLGRVGDQGRSSSARAGQITDSARVDRESGNGPAPPIAIRAGSIGAPAPLAATATVATAGVFSSRRPSFRNAQSAGRRGT